MFCDALIDNARTYHEDFQLLLEPIRKFIDLRRFLSKLEAIFESSPRLMLYHFKYVLCEPASLLTFELKIFTKALTLAHRRLQEIGCRLFCHQNSSKRR